MIGYIEGVIFDVASDSVLVQTSGVGYEILSTQQTIADAQMLLGQKMAFWIYTHVREDALTLFGFLTKPEKDFFMQLLKVNGVGPKSALTLLSGAPLSTIQNWIEKGDAKALSSLPKVGKKTAEQIILTLQGKLVILTNPKDNKTKPVRSETFRQMASALMNLGFKPQLVEQFIETVPQQTTLEEGIRLGLKTLSNQKEVLI